jgi:hypothetical protein
LEQLASTLKKATEVLTISFLWAFPKSFNRKLTVEHTQSESMGALDDTDVFSAAQTDHARLIRCTNKNGYSPWITVLREELLVSRPVEHQASVLNLPSLKQRQQEPGAKSEVRLAAMLK